MKSSSIKKIRNDTPQMLKARAIVEAHISHFGMVPHPDLLKEAIASALQRFNADTDWKTAKVSIDMDTHFDGNGLRVFGRVVDWQPEDWEAGGAGKGIGLNLLCEYESDNFGMRWEDKREDQPAHKVMTPEEYAATPLQGWHEVCRDVDGFGGVGIRYRGV